MKSDLTIYVMPCGKDEIDPERAVKSFENPQYTVAYAILEHANLWDLNGTHYESRWFGYIYANEWLDEELSEALPVFLQQDYFDYLLLWKKVEHGDKSRYFRMPRLFRSVVPLIKGELVPENIDTLTGETVLNGWILENAR